MTRTARKAPGLLRAAAILPWVAALAVCAGPVLAQSAAPGIPRLSVAVEPAGSPEEVSSAVQLLLLLTVLSVAPAILLMCTSFTRIVIVLSLTRTALGTQQIPPNPVLLGLALFLTFFTMGPTLEQVNSQAVRPYLDRQISFDQAVEAGAKPVREFMLKQAREQDIALFVKLARLPQPKTPDDIPMNVLAPAFLISELKTAFTIGFVVFIPFLVIDMVVSITLMSMGMMMLPPVIVSLPFKILLFVLVDGWQLIVQSLSLSFR